MFRQICPACMKAIDLPDDAAGRDATCPLCSHTFKAPARYVPVVNVEKAPPPPTAPETSSMSPAPDVSADRPPPPPGLVPPPPPGLVPPGAVGEHPPADGTYKRTRTATIPRQLFDWMPAACLVLAALLTFATWTGSYPAGYAAYTQGPWRMVGGSFGWDHVLEDVLQIQGPLVPLVRSDWELMVPFLLCLWGAAGLAVAERVVRNPTVGRLPRRLEWLNRVWPYRLPLIAGLATIALLLVMSQAAAGFGLERGMEKLAAQKFADERKQKGDNRAEQFRLDVRESMFVGQYHLERTTWYYLSTGLTLVALFGLIARVRFDRRGTLPPPRVTVQY